MEIFKFTKLGISFQITTIEEKIRNIKTKNIKNIISAIIHLNLENTLSLKKKYI